MDGILFTAVEGISLIFAAKRCSGTHNISNGSILDPAVDGHTGYQFTVSCPPGFSLSNCHDVMICDAQSNWFNAPSCLGEYHCTKNNINRPGGNPGCMAKLIYVCNIGMCSGSGISNENHRRMSVPKT